MSFAQKFHTALDETRLLVLVCQILFGFQFESTFQQNFDKLDRAALAADAAGLMLMVLTIGLLIAPSSQHRLVERGRVTCRIRDATTGFAAVALATFTASFASDVFLVFERLYGTNAGLAAGAGVAALCLGLWYGVGALLKDARERRRAQMEKDSDVELHEKIDQMLTEARVVLPGAQALLGFQFIATLTQAFEKLSPVARNAHMTALLLVALAAVLLMTPAAIHRIAYSGEDSERFHVMGSGFVTAALLPLSVGISLDVYVALGRITARPTLSAVAAGLAWCVLVWLWYAQPLVIRSSVRRAAHAR
jgi:hypothetical protein